MKIVVPIGVFTITRSMTGERLSSTSAQPSRNSCNKNKSNNKRKIRKIRKTTLKFYEIFIYYPLSFFRFFDHILPYRVFPEFKYIFLLVLAENIADFTDFSHYFLIILVIF